MKLRVLIPDGVSLDTGGVTEVRAEAGNGAFGVLEHHIDFVTALVPCILSYRRGDGESFLAVDEGALVKIGDTVTVSVRSAVAGPGLGKLAEVVRSRFEALSDSEKKARAAVARLEAGLTRRLLELRGAGHG